MELERGIAILTGGSVASSGAPLSQTKQGRNDVNEHTAWWPPKP